MQEFTSNTIKNIYFVAIGGTGMTALAGMLKSQGYQVSGSDGTLYPPMSTFLEELDIPVFSGFDAKHLDPVPDLVVIGNAMSRGNPEVEAVLQNRLNYISLPFALREFFIRGCYSCVVAGTHGKTTASSLLAWVLESAGKDPGFFIGGIPENFGRGFKVGNGGLFVAEGDEYDSAFFDKGSKFLHYLPDLVILNNIEFDHADIFDSLDDIVTTFSRLINLIPGNGHLIACWDDPLVRKLSSKAFSQVHTFGLHKDADWQARNISTEDGLTRFEVTHRNELIGEVEIPLFGEHMVLNSLGVLVACHLLGVSQDEIGVGLKTFKNIRRRLQFMGETKGIKIFDDFAHHPTEVKATLNGLRDRFPQNRLWAIYEPRTATSKRKVLEEATISAFEPADSVILTPLHAPEKVPENERLSAQTLKAGITRLGKQVRILPADSEMLDFLQQHLKEGDVVLFMSNGDFNQMPVKLLETL